MGVIPIITTVIIMTAPKPALAPPQEQSSPRIEQRFLDAQPPKQPLSFNQQLINQQAAKESETAMNLDIETRIKRSIEDVLGVASTTVTPTYHFIDEGADSLDIVELVMDLENEFQFEITDDEIDTIMTFKDLYELVEGKLK